jgi:hypothetical protein
MLRHHMIGQTDILWACWFKTYLETILSLANATSMFRFLRLEYSTIFMIQTVTVALPLFFCFNQSNYMPIKKFELRF